MTAHSADHELYEVVRIECDAGEVPPALEVSFPADIPDPVRQVLEGHRAVFALPRGMPPQRQFDHRIHLARNTKPINVRPYRYPYFQKK